jgi:hypothetical protein
MQVADQCDNKLADQRDECERLADAIIRGKERNTNILNTVTDFIDWLSDHHFLNMISLLWYYNIIVIYHPVT